MATDEDQDRNAAPAGMSLETALMKVASELSEAAAALRKRVDQLRGATGATSPPDED
ncbi:MAG TPA: hypothetical protein VGL92_07525 [Acidimicrobiia bacterium]|jgi:hypothetical protein